MAQTRMTCCFVRAVFWRLGTLSHSLSNAMFREKFLAVWWIVQSLEPLRLDSYWNPKIIIDNAVGDPKENTSTSVSYDVLNGEAFIFERRRIKGTFMENLELFHFPFDTQVRMNARLTLCHRTAWRQMAGMLSFQKARYNRHMHWTSGSFISYLHRMLLRTNDTDGSYCDHVMLPRNGQHHFDSGWLSLQPIHSIQNNDL